MLCVVLRCVIVVCLPLHTTQHNIQTWAFQEETDHLDWCMYMLVFVCVCVSVYIHFVNVRKRIHNVCIYIYIYKSIYLKRMIHSVLHSNV